MGRRAAVKSNMVPILFQQRDGLIFTPCLFFLKHSSFGPGEGTGQA